MGGFDCPENERDPEEDPGLVTVFVRQEGAGRVCDVLCLPALHRGFDKGNRRKRSDGKSELPGSVHPVLHGLGTPVLCGQVVRLLDRNSILLMPMRALNEAKVLVAP